MIDQSWIYNVPYNDWSDHSKIEKYESVINMAQDIIDRGWSVRQVAKEYLVGKSTVSRWIEKYLKHLDNDLYHEVKYVLKFHKKHTRAWRRRL